MKKLLSVILILCSLYSNSQAIKAAVTMRHSTAASSSLLTGLVGYWKFDESSGTITDYSGNSNTGTTTSVTYSATGIINTALSYNGMSSYVDMGTPSVLELTTTGSLSVWVYCSSFSVQYPIIGNLDYNNDLHGYMLSLGSTGTIDIGLADNSTHQYYSSQTISTNTWTHIVVTWDGSNINVYKNGSITSDSPISQTVVPTANTSSFKIGKASVGSNYFNGTIDEVAIFNRVISSSEVTTLYSSGSGKAYPFSFIIFPMKYFGQPYQSDPIGMVIPIEKYFADKPKLKIAA